MPRNWLQRAVLALLIPTLATSFSACAVNPDNRTLEQGAKFAAEEAVSESAVPLPPLPDNCPIPISHTSLTVGAELSVILRRERARLDKANADKKACALFYERLRASYARGQGASAERVEGD